MYSPLIFYRPLLISVYFVIFLKKNHIKSIFSTIYHFREALIYNLKTCRYQKSIISSYPTLQQDLSNFCESIYLSLSVYNVSSMMGHSK